MLFFFLFISSSIKLVALTNHIVTMVLIFSWIQPNMSFLNVDMLPCVAEATLDQHNPMGYNHLD